MTEADYDALYLVLADSDIMQHYPYTFDEARVRGWIEKNAERYRIFGFGLWAVCLRETGEMIGDCGLTMQLIHGQIKPEIGYHIRKDQQRKGYAREAAAAVRDWTFRHTPFQIIYSYMKDTNIPSCKAAASWGCKQVEEYKDEENGITKVFAISREEWMMLDADNSLVENLDRLHTTEQGAERIKKNLSLDTNEVTEWCKAKISSGNASITRRGKNWYVEWEEGVLTVNAYSYTIITAHSKRTKRQTGG